MARILKTTLGDLYDRNIKIAYTQGWDPNGGNQYKSVYQVLNATTQDIRSTYISGFGPWPVKNFGANVEYDQILQGYDTTITPVTYASAFMIEQETVEDEPNGLLGQSLAANLAAMGQYTVEMIAAEQFVTGFAATTSASMTGGDGQYFFDTDHAILAGGVYANKPSTDVDLSYAAIQAGMTNLRKTQGPRGELQGLKAQTLIVSPDQEWLAKEILGSNQVPYTADNTINAVRQAGLQLFVWDFLTDADAWFIKATNAPMRNGTPSGPGATAVAVWRVMPEFDRDNEFNSGDRRYKGRLRFGAGRLDWRGFYGSSGG